MKKVVVAALVVAAICAGWTWGDGAGHSASAPQPDAGSLIVT